MHELPKLTYEYNALEPHIDSKTMEIHHTKHHAGYTAKLNAALENLPDFQDMSVQELMVRLPEISDAKLQTAVRNNGGGYANHSLFWEILSPEGSDNSLEEELEKALESEFGSMSEFKTKFAEAAGTRFGSGWAWLVVDADKKLKIMSTPNQDNPWMESLTPILALDVWEHAYYLNYQNRRPDYIKAFWNVVNWGKVGELYGLAIV